MNPADTALAPKTPWPSPEDQHTMREKVLKALAGRPPRLSAEEEWQERTLVEQNHECYLRDRWRRRWALNGERLSQRRLGRRGNGTRLSPWLNRVR